MLIDRSQQEGDDWNKELLAYERKKRTKFPHGRDRPGLVRRHVSHHDAIEKELRFNPLLGVYREEVERNKSMEMEAKAAANERDRYEVGRGGRSAIIGSTLSTTTSSTSSPRSRCHPARRLSPNRTRPGRKSTSTPTTSTSTS